MDNSKKLPSNKREKVVAPKPKKSKIFLKLYAHMVSQFFALFSLVMWQ